MAERRVLLGTGAVVVGLGAALLAGSGTAHADGTDDGSGNQQSSSGSSASSGKATGGSKRASKSATGPKSAAANSDRKSSRTSLDSQTTKASTPSTTTPSTPSTTKTGTATEQDTEQSATPAAGVTTTSSTSAAVDTGASAAPQTVPVSVAVGTSRRAAEAAARQAQINQILASAGTITASASSTAAPASGLLATAMLNLLSGLGVAPRSAAPTEPSAPVTSSAPLLPTDSNGVTGVLVGHSRLELPGAFIGQTVAADWYFPTQADGSVDAQGVIWLQHGFAATNTFYSALAQNLAQQTNSIVVAPTLSSIPITFSGGCLTCEVTQQDAAALLGPDRATLLASATAAGFTGTALPERFVLAGHSAGGGFATAVADDYLEGNDSQYDPNDLVGVVMFDGVSNGSLDGAFAAQVSTLAAAGKPIYQIAAPAQSWNLFGATTNVLAATLPGQFIGVVLQGGSHVDSMLGVNPLFDFVLQLVTKAVPAGNTQAVYTLSDGWINDMYSGATPQTPKYGLYAASNQQIIMGPTAAVGLPAAEANQLSFGDYLVKALIDTVGGIFGFHLPAPVNGGNNGLNPNTPVATVGNGVTGVRTGSSVLDIPAGQNGYAAPADWYFPTQADGTVQANGVIWLQHGFLGFKDWYASMAQELAQQTNSIVVVPNIFWFDNPLCPGCYLGGAVMRQAVASMFQDSRSALNISANAAGFQGTLPEKFLLTGHSAGGNFATAVGALITDTPQKDNLMGVVMFDGVSRNPLFTDSLQALYNAGIPDYQIAAPPQSWNAYGVATELMQLFYGPKGLFYGCRSTTVRTPTSSQATTCLPGSVRLPARSSCGRHRRAARTRCAPSPRAGSTTSMQVKAPPTRSTDLRQPQRRHLCPEPADRDGSGRGHHAARPAAGERHRVRQRPTWYEQGSVKLPFAWGLVNTTAVYTLNSDGTVKVQNSGNYFGPNGPLSQITGTAVSVNPAFNTRLDVGFFGSTPSSAEPGNYWILDYDPNYQWVIVSDPTSFSGYILTRDKTISDTQYDTLVTRARQLGVWGPITRTQQYPTTL